MRLLKMHGLTRKVYADLGEVIYFIIYQLKGPGRLHRYRWMHKKGIRAKKEERKRVKFNAKLSYFTQFKITSLNCVKWKDIQRFPSIS